MKGRTTCPKCNHSFIVDTPKDKEKLEVICSNCNNKFTIKPSKCASENIDDCTWEEYGEPRKTILSSIKPKTGKPLIVSFLLFLVFIIGVSSAALPDIFVQVPSDILTNAGLRGTVEIEINADNDSFDPSDVQIDGLKNPTLSNSKYISDVMPLGIQKIKISYSGLQTIIKEVLVTPFIPTSIQFDLKEDNSTKNEPYNFIGFSIIIIIFSIFALLAAVMIYNRQHYNIAIISAILAIFSFGFLFIGSIISIISLFIILRCKEEFDNGEKGKEF